MTVVRDRPFSTAVHIKIDRALQRQASRDRLRRVREALALLAAELEAAARASRRSYSQGEFIEERWLREVKHARYDLDQVEL